MAKYINATDLGVPLGLSARAVGHKLVEMGLKDAASGMATESAVAMGLAKNIPYNETTRRPIWHRVEVNKLLGITVEPANKADMRKAEIAKYVRQVRAILRDAQRELEAGNDKMAKVMVECAILNVPMSVRKDVAAALGLEWAA